MAFGTFMKGAQNRLLPPMVPFGFFGAALVFHAAAWILLAVFAEQVPAFLGGPGPVLAAVHLVTLGVLTLSAMGAAFQILPVLTKKEVSAKLGRLGLWHSVAGIVLLCYGMYAQELWTLAGGGLLMVGGLTALWLILASAMRGYKEMPAVIAHVRVVLGSLVVFGLAGLVLITDLWWGFLPDHGGLAVAHAVVAAYGFMGMLAFGFSFVLVPMLATAPYGQEQGGRASAWLGAAALAFAFIGLAFDIRPALLVGGALGLATVVFHVRIMVRLMASRMRKELGDSFVLVCLGWVLLPASIVVGLMAAMGLWQDSTAPLFGFLVVFGWLLSFTLGILQRIMPFLASMHTVGGEHKPVRLADLTSQPPLRLHLICHCAALLLMIAGIVGENTLAVRLGASAGLVGAISLLLFAGLIWKRVVQHR